MADLHDLTAAEAARQIRAGAVRPTAYVNACLARIDAGEPAIGAWVHLDREGALHAAQESEREVGRGRNAGSLHGIPVALKDIIDVAGLPTTAGAGTFAHQRPSVDATVVTRLRSQGAVILGKVTTTAFAFLDPSPTRNPWNLAYSIDDLGIALDRAIVGGTGPYTEARGVQRETNLGFNATDGMNFSYEISLVDQ